MVMPNFLIIGAQKAGTTSLYSYVKQHPQIYLSPVKEPHFFAIESEELNFNGPFRERPNMITDLKSYQLLFQGVTNEISIGEASSWYFHSPKAVKRIQYYIPDVKLIAILRDPVERAFSNFRHCRRRQIEPLTDFTQTLYEEENRRQKNWGHPWYYKQKGLYYVHLKRYFDAFDRNQIRVYLTEDLSTNPIGVLQDIFHFLNVDEKYVPDVSKRKNTSDRPPQKLNPIRLLVKQLTQSSAGRGGDPAGTEFQQESATAFRSSGGCFELAQSSSTHTGCSRQAQSKRYQIESKPAISPALRKELIEQVYREDILKLQDLIQRDLSQWLK